MASDYFDSDKTPTAEEASLAAERLALEAPTAVEKVPFSEQARLLGLWDAPEKAATGRESSERRALFSSLLEDLRPAEPSPQPSSEMRRSQPKPFFSSLLDDPGLYGKDSDDRHQAAVVSLSKSAARSRAISSVSQPKPSSARASVAGPGVGAEIPLPQPATTWRRSRSVAEVTLPAIRTVGAFASPPPPADSWRSVVLGPREYAPERRVSLSRALAYAPTQLATNASLARPSIRRSARRTRRSFGSDDRKRPWGLSVPMLLLFALLFAAMVSGLFALRAEKARVAMELAREQLAQPTVASLHAAVASVQRAARLGYPVSETTALAARLQGALVVEFSEGDPRSLRSLLRRSRRHLADRSAAQLRDLSIAGVYLAVHEKPWNHTVQAIASAREQYPDDVTLSWLDASLAATSGDAQRAERILQALPGDNPRVLRELAVIQWRSGRRTIARRTLRAAVRVGLHEDQAAFVLLQLAVFSATRPDSLRLSLQVRQSTTHPSSRLARLKRSSSLSAQAQAWLALADARRLLWHNRFDAALKRFRAALAVSHRPAAFSYWAAQVAFDLRRYARADRLARAAERRSGKASRFRALRSWLALAMGRTEQVIARLASRRQHDAFSRVLLVRACLRAGRHRQVRRLLRHMRSSDPQAYALLRARNALALGRYHDAGRQLARIRRNGSWGLEARLVAAMLAHERGQTKRAEALVRAVLGARPMNVEARWLAGKLALAAGKLPVARRELAAAVHADPHRVQLRLEFGSLLFRLGEFSASRRQYTAALALAPERVEALAGRARASVELNRSDSLADLDALRRAGRHNLALLLAARRWMHRARWQEARQLFARIDGAWLQRHPQGSRWLATLESQTL